MNEYAKFAGPLLVIAGFFFQWVRQHSRVREFWTPVFASALACGVYLLVLDFSVHVGIQGQIVNAALWISEHVGSILGGTWAASSMAKAGVAVIPLTNSK